MRHRVFKNHLGRPTKQAQALYKSLVAALLKYGRIETTLAKAKAVRREIPKPFRLIRLGQRLSDTAEMVIIELIEKVEEKPAEKPVEKPKKKA